MLNRLRTITKNLPAFLTALLLAVAVWIMAVTSSDPSETRTYPNPVPIEILGQASDLVVVSDLPDSVSINLRAPTSIWNTIINEKVGVRAIIDLSGLEAGEHNVPVQVQVGIKPAEVTSYNPRSIYLALEPQSHSQFEIKVVNRGALPVDYQSEDPQLSETSAIVSGAKSQVEQVTEVRAIVDLSEVRSDINQTISLQPVDANGMTVRNVTVSPEKITLIQAVVQRGGYRNVVVKVVTGGQIPDGFRLTSISVFPPTITVYSTDPELVDALPGYVDTTTIDLSQKVENFEQLVTIILPSGIKVIGDKQVSVKVGISPVESSLAVTDVQVETIGLASNLQAKFLPDKVNVILSGPVPLLESLVLNDLRVLIDLTGILPGTYTLEPKVSLNIQGLNIESISPESFEITVTPLK